MSIRPTDWQNLDQRGSDWFIDYLKRAAGNPDLARRKRQLDRLLLVKAGDRILDIGCGLGHDASALAATASPGGFSLGIDRSLDMLLEAARQHHGPPPGLAAADAHDLPFSEGSFDAARFERVLIHVGDPAKAIGEAFRVLRRGGRLAASEPEHASLTIGSADHEVEQAVMAAYRMLIRQPYMGRQLPRLLAEAGFERVTVRHRVSVARSHEGLGLDIAVGVAVKNGSITKEEGEAWLNQLADSVAKGALWISMTHVIVRGFRP